MVDERGGSGSRRKEEYALGVRLTVLVARENAAGCGAGLGCFATGRVIAVPDRSGSEGMALRKVRLKEQGCRFRLNAELVALHE
jgi:hypothetical protein